MQCGLQIWTIGFEPLNGNELRSNQYHKVEGSQNKTPKGSKTSYKRICCKVGPNTIQNPPNPPGLEACFEQVAQGLWLVRRVRRRSKTVSLPARLELPSLRLTASGSNQLSYGSITGKVTAVGLEPTLLRTGA